MQTLLLFLLLRAQHSMLHQSKSYPPCLPILFFILRRRSLYLHSSRIPVSATVISFDLISTSLFGHFTLWVRSVALARTPTLRVFWKLQEPGTNLLSVYSCASGMLLALSHLRTHISSLPSAVLKASPSHQLAHYPSFIWYRSPAMLHLLLLSYPSH